MEQLMKGVATVESLQGLALVAVACLVIGYVFKLIPAFPNQAIPVVVVLIGMALTPVLDAGKAANESMRVWAVSHVLYGMIVGFVVWTFHALLLKKFEDKIPLLGKLLENASKPAESEKNEPNVPPAEKPVGG